MPPPKGNVCPLTLLPPERPVHLDIPDASGNLSLQVYKYNQLYRMIATIGTCRQSRNVVHTLNGQGCDRRQALELVRAVPDELLRQITTERERRRMSTDVDPLTVEDREQYAATMQMMDDPLWDNDDYAQQEFGPVVPGPVCPEGEEEEYNLMPPQHHRSPAAFAARRRAAAELSAEVDSDSCDKPMLGPPHVPNLRNVAQRTSTGRGGGNVGGTRLQPRESIAGRGARQWAAQGVGAARDIEAAPDEAATRLHEVGVGMEVGVRGDGGRGHGATGRGGAGRGDGATGRGGGGRGDEASGRGGGASERGDGAIGRGRGPTGRGSRPARAAVAGAGARSRQLGTFLTEDGTDVRSTHLQPLTDWINLAASSHANGIVATLGHSKRGP